MFIWNGYVVALLIRLIYGISKHGLAHAAHNDMTATVIGIHAEHFTNKILIANNIWNTSPAIFKPSNRILLSNIRYICIYIRYIECLLLLSPICGCRFKEKVQKYYNSEWYWMRCQCDKLRCEASPLCYCPHLFHSMKHYSTLSTRWLISFHPNKQDLWEKQEKKLFRENCFHFDWIVIFP